MSQDQNIGIWGFVIMFALVVGSLWWSCSGAGVDWCRKHCAPHGFAFDSTKGSCACVELPR